MTIPASDVWVSAGARNELVSTALFLPRPENHPHNNNPSTIIYNNIWHYCQCQYSHTGKYILHPDMFFHCNS